VYGARNYFLLGTDAGFSVYSFVNRTFGFGI